MLYDVATSTDSERSFSRGRLTVSRLRHSLSDESVRTGTVLGSWSNYPELVPETEIINLLAEKVRVSGGSVVSRAATQEVIVVD